MSEPAEKLRAFIRKIRPGGCKMFSQGARCECPLCDVDRMADAQYAAEARAEALQRRWDNALALNSESEYIVHLRDEWVEAETERRAEKQRADALAAELAALRAVTRDALNELWATYGDTPRTLPLMVRLEQALPPPPGSENRT